MAITHNTPQAPFGAITLHRIVSAVEGLWARVSEWNARRKTRAILSRLSDRELADIGLHRGALEDLPPRF